MGVISESLTRGLSSNVRGLRQWWRSKCWLTVQQDLSRPFKYCNTFCKTLYNCRRGVEVGYLGPRPDMRPKCTTSTMKFELRTIGLHLKLRAAVVFLLGASVTGVNGGSSHINASSWQLSCLNMFCKV